MSRVVHRPAEGQSRTLATDVEVADGVVSRALGLMGRASVPGDYALVFPFRRAGTRGIHTLFVRVPIDVVWTDDDVVTRVATLRPWTGLARARGDRVIELAAGAADGVDPGDEVVLVEGSAAAPAGGE